MKRNNFILILLLFLAFSSIVPANAQVFDLSSTKKSELSLNQDYPCVYKPSKLIIGLSNSFTVKAEPKSHVSLVTSNENGGYPEVMGHKLRIGQSIKNYEGVVGDNGVIELEVPIANEKQLAGQILYFEVLVWKNANFSDLKIAKIMGIDGKETDINAVVVTAQPKKTFLPGFGPALPGMDMDINRTIDSINRSNHDDNEYIYEEQTNYNNEPLMIRNLRAPDLKKDK